MHSNFNLDFSPNNRGLKTEKLFSPQSGTPACPLFEELCPQKGFQNIPNIDFFMFPPFLISPRFGIDKVSKMSSEIMKNNQKPAKKASRIFEKWYPEAIGNTLGTKFGPNASKSGL